MILFGDPQTKWARKVAVIFKKLINDSCKIIKSIKIRFRQKIDFIPDYF